MMGIFDVMNETFSSVNPAGGVVWFAHFEAMPSVMLAKSAKNGGNVLGLKPEDGNGIGELFFHLHYVPSEQITHQS